jgi:hypothetical protein
MNLYESPSSSALARVLGSIVIVARSANLETVGVVFIGTPDTYEILVSSQHSQIRFCGGCVIRALP